MRSILLQSRRINSSRALLLPRLSSSPSCSSSPSRFNSSTSSSTEPKPSELPISSTSSLLEPQPSPSSSQIPSTRRPPPPLHVPSQSTPPASPAGGVEPTPSSLRKPPISSWWSQAKKVNRHGRARALIERLGVDGGGKGAVSGSGSSPDIDLEARTIFKYLRRSTWPTDEDL